MSRHFNHANICIVYSLLSLLCLRRKLIIQSTSGGTDCCGVLPSLNMVVSSFSLGLEKKFFEIGTTELDENILPNIRELTDACQDEAL